MIAPAADEADVRSRAQALVASLPAALGSSRPDDPLIAPPSPVLPYVSDDVAARARTVGRGLLGAGVVLLGLAAWL
ncbi:MAG: hypothetical protein U0P30_09475 [Vicinamibacterales bacterium]